MQSDDKTKVSTSVTVWTAPATIEVMYEKTAGNKFASINRPTAGIREERAVEVGKAPYQLYSIATPNGIKIGIILEELKLDYDEHKINILAGDQFTSGFTAINPNQKIPAMVDNSDPENPVNLFESGGILMYLADKHQQFIPGMDLPKERAEVVNWLMWQMGVGPFFGQFGHFFVYSPRDKIEANDYGVVRYGMEVQRCLDVLDKQLERNHSRGGFVSSWGYSIADMAIFPWVRGINAAYKATDFLGLEKYKFVNKWLLNIQERPAVIKGLQVTSFQSK